MDGVSDWFWSPLLDPTRIWVGIMLVVILAVSVTGAMWSYRVPGEVASRERANLRNGTRAIQCLFGILFRLMPLCLVIGTTLLFFPISPPKTLLLSSRARITDEGDWTKDWTDAVAKSGASADDGYLDLGPLVDDACEHIAKPNSQANEPLAAHENLVSNWRPDDPTVRAYLEGTVQGILAEREPSTVTDPTQVKHRVETRLPRWVVESIELGILRGQTQRCNTRRVVALTADRATRFGNAWDRAEDYLRLGAPNPSTAYTIVRIASGDPVRIEQVYDLQPDGERVTASCIFSVRPINNAQKIELFLVLKNQPNLQIREDVNIPATDRFLYVFPKVTFTGVPATAEIEAVKQNTTPPHSIRVSRAAGGTDTWSELVQLRVQEPNAWKTTFEKLKTDPAFSEWVKRMENLDHNPNKISFSDTGGSLVIDTQTTPGGVWIYPAEFATEPGEADARLSVLLQGGQEAKSPVRARRAAPGDMPGVDSWDLLPLAEHGPTPTPIAVGDSAAERRLLALELASGATLRNGETVSPFVTRLVEPVRPAGGRRIVLTYIALNPVEQGVILAADGTPHSNYERARVAVFWTAILDALRRAPDARLEEAEAGADAPIPLLNSTEREKLRASALTTNLVPLLVGLLIFAVFVRMGIANAPPKRTETPS